MKFFYGFIFLFIATFDSFGQGYKTFESTYFEVGDSIRVDVSLIGDPYYREWNVRGEDKEVLVNFLKRNPRLKIELNAYTDTKGSNESNLDRSKLRAESLLQWLIEGEGFDNGRFRHKGWGEEKPIFSDEQIYAHRGDERHKWDSLQAINRRIIIVIDDIEQRVNCAYRSADDPDLKQYYKNDPEIMAIGNKFRLDFIAFQEESALITGFSVNKAKYDELAAFILCHPGVNFQVSVHDDSFGRSIVTDSLTQARAISLVEFLSTTYTIPKSRFRSFGYGHSRPIIPDMIIDELADDKAKQDELHAINRRSELEVIGIGAFNDIAFNKRMQLTDLEMAHEGIIYMGYQHHIKLETRARYDSIQMLYNHDELHISQSKVNSHRWNVTIVSSESLGDYTNISFLGWSKGMAEFLSSKSFEIAAIEEPEIYLGENRISNIDLNEYKDLELFTSNHLVARYDTSKYFLLKSYPVVSYELKVGRKKFVEDGADFSTDLMRAIRKAKPDMIIHFEHMEIQKGSEVQMHEIHEDYIKKTKTKKNVLFQALDD